jgi:WS/DGAT/MGAT family acyltransferase
MLSLTDFEPDAGIGGTTDSEDAADARGILPSVAAMGAHAIVSVGSVGVNAIRQSARMATSPSHAATVAGAIARDGATALRLLLTPADAATAIKGNPGISRRVAWSSPLSLKRIKRIGRAHNASVNDVLLTAVSGALRHYLKDRGGPVAEIQAMVPFNLRPLDQPVPRNLGNKFGLVMLPLPVGTSGSYRRLVEVHRRMDEIKHTRNAAVSYGILSAAGVTPETVERRIVDMFSAKSTAVMTNVPGPREPVYFAGSEVRTVLVWAPTSGHIGMSVSIFSYRGEVTVGLMVDAMLVPDPDRIVAELEQELGVLARLRSANGSASQPRPDRARHR